MAPCPDLRLSWPCITHQWALCHRVLALKVLCPLVLVPKVPWHCPGPHGVISICLGPEGDMKLRPGLKGIMVVCLGPQGFVVTCPGP